jgi:transposase
MGQKWAYEMAELLLDINVRVGCFGGVLPIFLQDEYRGLYKGIIVQALVEAKYQDWIAPPGQKGKRGRPKMPAYVNLLGKLIKYEDEILRFMTNAAVPFTNNDAERPVRMVKVRMKISGCFKTFEMASNFCDMYGYIASCEKNGIRAFDAVKMLMNEQTPAFIQEVLDKHANKVNEPTAA